MAENMRDMTLNLIVNSQVGKLEKFNKELQNTDNKIDNVTKKTGWLGRTLRGVFGAYLGIQGVKDLINTHRQIDMVQRSLNALTGSAEMGAKHFDFLKRVAFQTGSGIMEVAKAYRGYYYAAKTAGLADEELQHSFLGVMIGARVLGANKQQVGGAMLALEQMLNKTTVQAQEMNLQLGNAISGAREMAAEAMGMSVSEFTEKMQKKQINSAEFVRKFGDYMYKQFLKKLPEAMKSLDASIINMQNAWILFKEEVVGSAKGEMGQSLTKLTRQLMKLLMSEEIKLFAKTLGFVLAKITDLLSFVLDHLGQVLFFLSPVMLGGALTKTISLLSSAYKWIVAGNLALSTTQVLLLTIFLGLLQIDDIIAFLQGKKSVIGTALFGEEGITAGQRLVAVLVTIAGILATIIGSLSLIAKFKGVLNGITNTKTKPTPTPTPAPVTETSPILDAQGNPIKRTITPKNPTPKGIKGNLGKFGKNFAKFGKFGLAGEITAGILATSAVVGALDKYVGDPHKTGVGLPMGFVGGTNALNPVAYQKTDTYSPNINYQPKTEIIVQGQSSDEVVDKIKNMLDNRDRNFWTSLVNPTSLYLNGTFGKR